jgi:beta-lactam-binding protein with PASTA domain/predicted Ser/Thr protein kinase
MTEVTEKGIYNSRYEIIRQVARGGMAEVYLARDLQLHRPVALKVLFRELSTDPSFVQRFRHEAQAAANLSHPNIVSVYDWGESQEDNTYFIVMEYVDGEPLSKMLRTGGPLDPHRAAEIGADIAAGLGYAHAHGVIHRDVKPGNVLVTTEGTAKVTDFGIARGHNSDVSLTQTGAVMGTATYFSPEQAQGEHIDARSDIYSLAVVLYEMVAGRPPFSGDNPIAIATKHVREAPTPLSAIAEGVPEDFEAIVMKAMAKAPEDRYQSASELQADLAAFVAGHHVAAPPFDPSVTAFYEAGAAATIVAPAQARTRLAPPGRAPASVPPGRAASEGRPSRSGARLVALVTALIVLAALLGFGGYEAVRRLGSAGGSGFDVPNLIGMSLTKAESILARDGLHANIRFRSSPQSPGTVVDQSPAYPTPVSRGDSVTLTVSRGGEARVPSVVGDPQQQAADTLKKDGFSVQEVKRQLTCTQAVQLAAQGSIGNVISETPSGTTAPIGSTVQIVVSLGVAVPTVAGESESNASNQLGQCGFTLGTTTNQPSPANQPVPAGYVISTDPPSGTLVNPGDVVNLTVSAGAGDTVPSVVGDSQSQAESAITSAGLTYAIQTVPATGSCQVGNVCSQNPAAGSVVGSGSTVTISVGQSSAPSSTTSSTSSTTSTTTASSGGGTGHLPAGR